MNNKEYSKEMENLKNQMLDKLAEGISAIIRSLDSKEQRIEALKRLKKKPSDDDLKRIYIIANEKEDYETCEVLKEYFMEKGVTISN